MIRLSVDLAGSPLGPTWLSVELVLDPPSDWTPERVRQEAADHYGVPLRQVGEPVELVGA